MSAPHRVVLEGVHECGRGAGVVVGGRGVGEAGGGAGGPGVDCSLAHLHTAGLVTGRGGAR